MYKNSNNESLEFEALETSVPIICTLRGSWGLNV